MSPNNVVTAQQLKELYTTIVSVTNINNSILVDGYSTRSIKLSWSTSLRAK